MTIADNYAPTKVQGNGATVAFTFDWNMISIAYGVIIFENVATGVQTIQSTGFTIVLDSDGSGGTVTFVTAPPDTVYVIISRNAPVSQATTYKTSSGFQAKVVEDSLDSGIAIAQQQKDAIDRSLKTQIGGAEDITLPIPVADYLLGWNSAGDNLANIANVESGALVVSAGSTTERSLATRFADITNVKDFGAKGDGITDDYAAIQAAIDARTGGAVIFFPEGIYKIDTGLVVDGTIPYIFKGIGIGTGGRGSRIQTAEEIDLLTIGGSSVLANEQVTVEDLRFYHAGSPASGAAIKIVNMTAGVHLNRLRCESFFTGIQIESEGSGKSCYNVHLNECKLDANDNGLIIRTVTGGTSNFTNWITVNKCYIAHNTVNAIKISREASTGEISHLCFSKCYIETNNASYMLLDMVNADHCHFADCIFDGESGGTHISVDANCEFTTFIGCELTEDYLTGISDSIARITILPGVGGTWDLRSLSEKDDGTDVDTFSIYNKGNDITQKKSVLVLKHFLNGNGNAVFLQCKDNAGADLQLEIGANGNITSQGSILSLANLKSGTDQADAGAAAGELYVDTNDDNTVKRGT